MRFQLLKVVKLKTFRQGQRDTEWSIMFVSEMNELGGDKMEDKLYIDITRYNKVQWVNKWSVYEYF